MFWRSLYLLSKKAMASFYCSNKNNGYFLFEKLLYREKVGKPFVLNESLWNVSVILNN